MNFVVNPHNIYQTNAKSSCETKKGADSRPKLKLIPKRNISPCALSLAFGGCRIEAARDFTPPILRGGDSKNAQHLSGKAKGSPISSNEKGGDTPLDKLREKCCACNPEKTLSPRRQKKIPGNYPEDPVRDQPAVHTSQMLGHSTPHQEHVVSHHKPGYNEARSASATRKPKEGTATGMKQGGMVKVVNSVSGKDGPPYPRSYVTKLPASGGAKELPMKAFINKGIKR